MYPGIDFHRRQFLPSVKYIIQYISDKIQAEIKTKLQITNVIQLHSIKSIRYEYLTNSTYCYITNSTVFWRKDLQAFPLCDQTTVAETGIRILRREIVDLS